MGREKLTIPFVFEEANRSRLTFSDTTKVRLNPITNRIELRSQGYDLVTGLPTYPVLPARPWVRTWAVTPEAMRQWLSFWCEAQLPTGTSVMFRLNNGTADYFWNTTPPTPAWTVVVTEATDWSTHDAVAEHIATFPVTSGKIAVVVGLGTTNASVTPQVQYVDVLMDCELEWFYSILAATVLPELREHLQVPVDFSLNAPGGLRVSLLDVETPFNILSVGAVYDHQADPHHRTSLLSTYDATSRSILLTVSVARGVPLWIVFIAEPEVVVNWASQDYVEVEKIPAVVIDGIEPTIYQNFAEQHTKNIHTKTAVVRRRPLRLTVRFEVVLLAEKTRTLLAMMGQALKFISSHPVLRWRDLDQDVSLHGFGPALSGRPNLSDKHEAVAKFALENLYLWVAPEETPHLVERLNLSLSHTAQSGPLWPGA